ncbi:MAG: glycosyltransferase family 4 protein [Anaerolineae bacterium]|nr:glycosyltransferase family 4 protein [Anaerolineae bacterium]
MRVGIDATCWSNPRGYGRYARGLLTALLEQPSPQHEYVLFVDHHTFSQFTMPEGAQYVVVQTHESPTQAASAEGRRSFADMWAMTKAVARTPLDVFFFPSVYTYFPLVTRARIILGIHDVIAEDYPQVVFPDRRQYYLWTLKGVAARLQANYIVTVSDYAREGIMRRFKWPQHKIWIVGEAPDSVFQPIEDARKVEDALVEFGLNRSTRFMMCLGGLNPHKNLKMLLEVMAELRAESEFSDVHLLLVGPAETDTFTPGAHNIRALVQQLGLEDAVHFTGFISDEAVALLLNAARVLVMPSLAEGYGLGAVEAAACGTPVIVTQNSPMPQILEGGGLFIDPLKSDELQTALTTIFSDESARLGMGQTALNRSRALTWPHAADQFRSLLERTEQENP